MRRTLLLSCVLIASALTVQVVCGRIEASDDEFEQPVRITAGGQFVAVESPGYACPTMADVDGDGKQDLVVGQFNQGNMLFCRNIAKDGAPPTFAAADWIMSGDERAIVPGVW